MSEKTREVSKLADAIYAHTLVIESTREYKVHGPYGSNFPCTIVGAPLWFSPTLPLNHNIPQIIIISIFYIYICGLT